MAERETGSDDDLARALQALERAEKLAPSLTMRRTAAESAAPSDAGSLQSEIDRLRIENESLRARLSDLEQGNASVRREAAQLAGQVDRALEQLDLIEKG